MYWFTADEHYFHANIIKYCKRPFDTVDDMNDAMIRANNKVVDECDTVIHAGDFTLSSFDYAKRIIRRLAGNHVFLMGCHDTWLLKSGIDAQQIMGLSIEGEHVVVCHYAMAVWPKSHYNSWQVFGHSHGTLLPVGKQWDIGVDNNMFAPVSFERLCEIMAERPDNPNLVNSGSRDTPTKGFRGYDSDYE